MTTEALDSFMSQAADIVNRVNAYMQPIEAVVVPAHVDEYKDIYAQLDSLLLRKPDDRTAFQADHRSTRLREMSEAIGQWARTSAATDLDNWSDQKGYHSQSI